MQVDFHLTFIVDTKLKQDTKTRLVEVVKLVVWLSSSLMHQGSGISLVSKDDWTDLQNYLPFI